MPVASTWPLPLPPLQAAAAPPPRSAAAVPWSFRPFMDSPRPTETQRRLARGKSNAGRAGPTADVRGWGLNHSFECLRMIICLLKQERARSWTARRPRLPAPQDSCRGAAPSTHSAEASTAEIAKRYEDSEMDEMCPRSDTAAPACARAGGAAPLPQRPCARKPSRWQGYKPARHRRHILKAATAAFTNSPIPARPRDRPRSSSECKGNR